MPTYYVVSTATGAADGTSEADAWTTIDTAMNNVVAGDIVYVKATATYSETPNIDTAGGFQTPIIFEGYGTTPGDNGKVTISGTTNCLTGSVTPVYYIFKNFIFSGASSTGVYLSAGAADYVQFINCEFNSNGGQGIFGDNNYTFINCIFASNTTNGADVDTNGYFIGCIAYGNGQDAMTETNAGVFYKNVIYNNGSFKGIDATSAVAAVANTLDGENTGSQAIDFSSSSLCVIVDNVIYDWTAGINISSGAPVVGAVIGYNLMNSNTTDYNVTAGEIGYQDVTSAPSFVDEAGDDYRVTQDSPAVAAGLVPGGIT